MTSSMLMLIGFIWVGLAFYVAVDASKRGKSVLTWFLFTLLFGVISLLVYNIEISSSNRGSQSNAQKSTGTTNERGFSFDKSSGYSNQSVSEYTPIWRHEVSHRNYNDDPVVDVFDGKRGGRFVISDDDISPQSKVYERKFSSEWVAEAENYLRNEFKK